MPQLDPKLLTWLALGGLTLSITTLVALPLAIVRLPVDHFALDRKPRAPMHPVRHFVRNVLGYGLVLAGIAMLVLPGQGILTLLVGFALVDFPGKRSLELQIAHHPLVWRALNEIRRRGERPRFRR